MNILYITPGLQHPLVRGPTRCYHFIKVLSRKHRITLLSMVQGTIPDAALEEMRRYTEKILLFRGDSAEPGIGAALEKIPLAGKGLATLLRRRKALQQMRKALFDLAGSADVVLFHGKSVASVLDGFGTAPVAPVVIDFCDATSMRIASSMRYAGLVKRMRLALSYLRVRSTERKLIDRGAPLAFVSARDRESIMGRNGRGEVVSIGVDYRFWTRRQPPGPSRIIVFVGVMDYGPNEDTAVHLIDRVFPLVRKSVPDAEVVIVGRGASEALRRRARETTGITVTGFVDDVRPYLEKAALSAIPMRYGSGVQNKALEAMAMQVPVVTTPLVAAGLCVDGEADVPVYVADNDNEFAERIVYLLGHREELESKGLEGRRFVEANYDWSRNAAKLEQMCLDAAARGVHPSHVAEAG